MLIKKSNISILINGLISIYFNDIINIFMCKEVQCCGYGRSN